MTIIQHMRTEFIHIRVSLNMWLLYNAFLGVLMQATLAACNVTAVLQKQPVTKQDMLPFVDGPFDNMPAEAPSIVNAKDLPKDKFPQFK